MGVNCLLYLLIHNNNNYYNFSCSLRALRVNNDEPNLFSGY